MTSEHQCHQMIWHSILLIYALLLSFSILIVFQWEKSTSTKLQFNRTPSKKKPTILHYSTPLNLDLPQIGKPTRKSNLLANRNWTSLLMLLPVNSPQLPRFSLLRTASSPPARRSWRGSPLTRLSLSIQLYTRCRHPINITLPSKSKWKTQKTRSKF